ncbi:hypothetical protein H9P43_002733 [Blastocladiella emersonii ATCC 22665]|nr:hypothetical protein H9P43_002733 [Blastocladiella emersonii ATCC 22665]
MTSASTSEPTATARKRPLRASAKKAAVATADYAPESDECGADEDEDVASPKKRARKFAAGAAKPAAPSKGKARPKAKSAKAAAAAAAAAASFVPLPVDADPNAWALRDPAVVAQAHLHAERAACGWWIPFPGVPDYADPAASDDAPCGMADEAAVAEYLDGTSELAADQPDLYLGSDVCETASRLPMPRGSLDAATGKWTSPDLPVLAECTMHTEPVLRSVRLADGRAHTPQPFHETETETVYYRHPDGCGELMGWTPERGAKLDAFAFRPAYYDDPFYASWRTMTNYDWTPIQPSILAMRVWSLAAAPAFLADDDPAPAADLPSCPPHAPIASKEWRAPWATRPGDVLLPVSADPPARLTAALDPAVLPYLRMAVRPVAGAAYPRDGTRFAYRWTAYLRTAKANADLRDNVPGARRALRLLFEHYHPAIATPVAVPSTGVPVPGTHEWAPTSAEMVPRTPSGFVGDELTEFEKRTVAWLAGLESSAAARAFAPRDAAAREPYFRLGHQGAVYVHAHGGGAFAVSGEPWVRHAAVAPEAVDARGALVVVPRGEGESDVASRARLAAALVAARPYPAADTPEVPSEYAASRATLVVCAGQHVTAWADTLRASLHPSSRVLVMQTAGDVVPWRELATADVVLASVDLLVNKKYRAGVAAHVLGTPKYGAPLPCTFSEGEDARKYPRDQLAFVRLLADAVRDGPKGNAVLERVWFARLVVDLPETYSAAGAKVPVDRFGATNKSTRWAMTAEEAARGAERECLLGLRAHAYVGLAADPAVLGDEEAARRVFALVGGDTIPPGPESVLAYAAQFARTVTRVPAPEIEFETVAVHPTPVEIALAHAAAAAAAVGHGAQAEFIKALQHPQLAAALAPLVPAAAAPVAPVDVARALQAHRQLALAQLDAAVADAETKLHRARDQLAASVRVWPVARQWAVQSGIDAADLPAPADADMNEGGAVPVKTRLTLRDQFAAVSAARSAVIQHTRDRATLLTTCALADAAVGATSLACAQCAEPVQVHEGGFGVTPNGQVKCIECMGDKGTRVAPYFGGDAGVDGSKLAAVVRYLARDQPAARAVAWCESPVLAQFLAAALARAGVTAADATTREGRTAAVDAFRRGDARVLIHRGGRDAPEVSEATHAVFVHPLNGESPHAAREAEIMTSSLARSIARHRSWTAFLVLTTVYLASSPVLRYHQTVTLGSTFDFPTRTFASTPDEFAALIADAPDAAALARHAALLAVLQSPVMAGIAALAISGTLDPFGTAKQGIADWAPLVPLVAGVLDMVQNAWVALIASAFGVGAVPAKVDVPDALAYVHLATWAATALGVVVFLGAAARFASGIGRDGRQKVPIAASKRGAPAVPNGTAKKVQ